jgi:nicotinamidase-related amidase
MVEHKPIEKVAFSCFGAEGFSSALQRHTTKTILLTGIEAHVCVAQTALDAIDAGYRVCVIKDAVSSRTQENKQIGIDRVQERGAIITSTEAIMFEILEKAGTQEFKIIVPLLK